LYAKGGGTRTPGANIGVCPVVDIPGPVTTLSPYPYPPTPTPTPPTPPTLLGPALLTMISDELTPGFCAAQVSLFFSLFLINFFLSKTTKIVTRMTRTPMTIPAIAPPGSVEFCDEV
jgi:hypothetical protein